MKVFYIFLGTVFAAGAALYWQEIAALFAGMTPVEILKQIASFALHVAWITILGFLATTLPKMVKPWLRALKREGYHKIRTARRTPVVMRTQKPESLSVRQLTAVLAKQAGVRQVSESASQPTPPEIKLDM